LTQLSGVPRTRAGRHIVPVRARSGSWLYLCNDTRVSSYRSIRRSVIRWQRSRGERHGVVGTAVMPSSHVTIEKGEEKEGDRGNSRGIRCSLLTRGEREDNASARRGEEKRNGLAIRMKDVPTKVSLRLGLTINGSPRGRSRENEFRAVRKRCGAAAAATAVAAPT